MTTKEFQERSLLRIFLSYFKPHRRLFALDMTCAFLIALVDLAFPLVSRTAMYTWLPEKQFRVFFIVMAAVVVTYAVRSGLSLDLLPYGTLAVSPKYTIFSAGRFRMISLATVSPPIPESNTPTGASLSIFIHLSPNS